MANRRSVDGRIVLVSRYCSVHLIKYVIVSGEGRESVFSHYSTIWDPRMEGATNAGGIGPSGSSSSQIPVGVDEEVPIEVTLRLLPATRGAHSTPQSADAKSDPPPVPLAKTAILGLPDLALAAPRALLLLSSRSAVPSSHSCTILHSPFKKISIASERIRLWKRYYLEIS